MSRRAYILAVLTLDLALLGCDQGAGALDPDPEGCGTGPVIELNVGETVERSGAAAGTFCVGATSSGQEFVLITSSLALDGTTGIVVQSQNAVSVLGPPSPMSPAGPGPDGLIELSGAVPSDGFHTQIRAREEAELRIDAGAPRGPSALRSAPTAVQLPVLGELMTLNAATAAACSNPIMVTGRVEAVSERAVVVADTANPADGFEFEDFEHFAATFDTLVVPIVEAGFSLPSDIDGNGRTIVFFTKEVNALEGDDEEESFTSGFFFSRDLFPVEGPGTPLANCATSNEAEILYLLVPDPLGTVGAEISVGEVARFTVSSLVHEAQHLVNASARLYGHSGGPVPLETTWLNEALSHIAEELLFYRAANLTPMMDLGLDDLDNQALNAINEYQLLNYLRLRRFFLKPADNSPFNPDDLLATRGSAWSFLRYAADRSPGDDTPFFRGLVTSPTRGFQNFSTAVGGTSTALDWLGDWSVGLYADNRVAGLPLQFHDRSWDNPSIFQGAPFEPPYIQTTNLGPNPHVSRTLVGGGTAYFRFAADPQRVTEISITSGGGAPPASLRATVLRTR